jgi:hypothetical protein
VELCKLSRVKIKNGELIIVTFTYLLVNERTCRNIDVGGEVGIIGAHFGLFIDLGGGPAKVIGYFVSRARQITVRRPVKNVIFQFS